MRKCPLSTLKTATERYNTRTHGHTRTAIARTQAVRYVNSTLPMVNSHGKPERDDQFQTTYLVFRV